MDHAEKSPIEQINDLIVLAANLRTASDLCGRLTKTDEFVGMFDLFQRQMVEKLRRAATLLAEQEKTDQSEQRL